MSKIPPPIPLTSDELDDVDVFLFEVAAGDQQALHELDSYAAEMMPRFMATIRMLSSDNEKLRAENKLYKTFQDVISNVDSVIK